MTAPESDGCRATVVVTTHNRPDFAARAIDSALAQTVDDVEVVVVDDGSQPPFALRKPDRRVRVIRHDEARGVSAARNAGLRAARGAWITFLDDDDRLVADMLERSITAAERSGLPEPVATMAAVTVLDVDGDPAETLVPAGALVRGEDFFLEGRGAAGRAANSIVAPTDVMRAIGGFDEALESFQHDDLGLRLNAVASIAGIAEPLYLMTTHPESRVSGRWTAIPGDMERTLAKHPDAFARHRAKHARFLAGGAYYHLRAGNWADAVRWSLRALARNPRDRRVWFLCLAAFAGPHARAAYRRIVPLESKVPFSTLTKRRFLKYARRVANYPRAVVGTVSAPITTRALRRAAPDATRGARQVLVLCIYRVANAPYVTRLVRTATAHGWDVRLWALDRTVPELARHTVGESRGAKFPLLNGLMQGVDLDRFDWVVVADDDFEFVGPDLDDLLALAEVAGLDLVQPAHTELSHRDLEFGVRRPFALARRTTFVEIGPVFAVRRPLRTQVVPFPADHEMGWGLELEWFDLASEGARLGIVDAVPVRHLQPVGADYAKDAQADALRARLRERGVARFADVQRTLESWWVWQPVAPRDAGQNR